MTKLLRGFLFIIGVTWLVIGSSLGTNRGTTNEKPDSSAISIDTNKQQLSSSSIRKDYKLEFWSPSIKKLLEGYSIQLWCGPGFGTMCGLGWVFLAGLTG